MPIFGPLSYIFIVWFTIPRHSSAAWFTAHTQSVLILLMVCCAPTFAPVTGVRTGITTIVLFGWTEGTVEVMRVTLCCCWGAELDTTPCGWKELTVATEGRTLTGSTNVGNDAGLLVTGTDDVTRLIGASDCDADDTLPEDSSSLIGGGGGVA